MCFQLKYHLRMARGMPARGRQPRTYPKCVPFQQLFWVVWRCWHKNYQHSGVCSVLIILFMFSSPRLAQVIKLTIHFIVIYFKDISFFYFPSYCLLWIHHYILWYYVWYYVWTIMYYIVFSCRHFFPKSLLVLKLFITLFSQASLLIVILPLFIPYSHIH